MGRGISAGTMGIVILAILAGLVGAYIIRLALMREEPVAPAPPARLTVPLAATDLPAGRMLALGDIILTGMTRREMEDAGMDLMRTMMAPDQIIGRIVREPVRQGKPFLTTSLYMQGTRPDYLGNLKPGYRALSMQIPFDRGGALPAGSIVDVMFRATERRGTRGLVNIPEVTVRLLEGIQILDVYEPPTRPNQAPPPPMVTMAVTPEQAEVLETTVGRGQMNLVARPGSERVAVAERRKGGLALEDVLGIEPPPPVVLFATELYRRGSRSVNIFRDDKLVEQIRSQQGAPAQPATPPPENAAPPAPGPGGVTPTAPVPENPLAPQPAPVPLPRIP